MSSDRGDSLHADTREARRIQNARAQPFVLRAERPRMLLIGEDAGIVPVMSLAERLQGELTSLGGRWKPLVLMGSENPFPFRMRPSSVIVAGIPVGVIACMPLLERWGIPCRLASHADLPGCFDGPVTALADAWLASLRATELSEVELFGCGSASMLASTRELAARYGVPCQAAPADAGAHSPRTANVEFARPEEEGTPSGSATAVVLSCLSRS